MKINRNCKSIPMSKSDKDFKWYVSSCLTKRAYASRHDATVAALKYGSKYKTGYDAYHCCFCGKWHLTTQFREEGVGMSNSFHATFRDGTRFNKKLYNLSKGNKRFHYAKTYQRDEDFN